MVRASGGKVIVFSVIDDSFPNPDILSFQLPWVDFHRHLREEAKRRLEELRSELGGGDEMEIVIVRGQPARTIVQFAEEEGCDLIAMSTHGTAGLHLALVGSVTRRVLHQAQCPVLVVRLYPEENGVAG